MIVDLKQEKKAKKVHVFSIDDMECIWMKAGVVNFKLCDNAFDCLNCAFDTAMSRAVQHKKEKVTSWRQELLGKPYEQRECRHMLTGKVAFRLCGNAYRCDTCQFDQTLEEQQLQRSFATPYAHKVAGFAVADNYYYHRGHSWARVEHGGLVRIGADDFALRLIGRVTDMQLPRLGEPVEQTEIGWSLRREERMARMLSPVDGVVLAANHKVLAKPELAKQDPFGEGWLMVVEPRNLKRSLKNLLFAEEAESWLTSEAARLEAKAMEAYSMPLAASGGEIVDDIFGNVPDLDWDDLMHEFLLT